MEDVYFDFNGLVSNIRERKLSNVSPLFDYLTNEFVKGIIPMLMERGIKPGEKYFFDKRIAGKIGLDSWAKSLTYLSSEKPFDNMDYCPLKIDGLYYGIWLAQNVHDCTDREEPCVLLSGDTIYYAEKVYNYFIQKNK